MKKVKQTLAVLTMAGLLCGCASASGGTTTPGGADTAGAAQTGVTAMPRNMMYVAPASVTDPATYAAADETAPASDLSNVVNLYQAHRYWDDDTPVYVFPAVIDSEDAKTLLAQNGFVVDRGMNKTFHGVYRGNPYSYIPSFVTTDSMMHTYHLMFQHLLKHTERTYLCDTLGQLSTGMYHNTLAQSRMLQDSEWKEAVSRNLVFFAVAMRLYDPDADLTELNAEELALAEKELTLISEASAIEPSPLFDREEDYSQYLPRGYYEGDEVLERYFRMMMWYGRRHFLQNEASLDRSALLMVLAMDDESLPEKVFSDWEKIYAVTSFFAGESEDNLWYDYRPLLTEAYGENITTADLSGTEDRFETYHALTAQTVPPRINSLPVGAGGPVPDEENRGFRFIGQRFSLDAQIFHNLIYDRVGANENGAYRVMPKLLDVPAAIGSDAALELLAESGDTEYEGYGERMQEMRGIVSEAQEDFWTGSLYAGWLDTLRPLLTDKGSGYPFFMQTDAWARKSLECFLGSFTELKHDTVLYSMQDTGGMGDGIEIIEYDDRGYVEPEPVLFARLAHLADETIRGLDAFGMLSDEDRADLEHLSMLATELFTIAEKELLGELPTDEEFDLIREYGNEIYYFWYRVYSEEQSRMYGGNDWDWVSEDDFPAALTVDIATNSDTGEILHVATGGVSKIYVIFPLEGTLRIGTGMVYSYYEYTDTKRVTDLEWQSRLGLKYDFYSHTQSPECGTVNVDDKPEWTLSFRMHDPWYGLY